MSPTLRIAILLAALVSQFGGCARWRPSQDEPSQLPAPRMSPDVVVMELAILPLPATGDDSAYERLWREIDEQHLPPELRQRLAVNGLQCGKTGLQLPDKLRELLQPGRPQTPFDDTAGLSLGETTAMQKRLQCRRGVRHELPMHAVRDHIDVLFHDEGGAVGGHPYEQAQSVFAWKTFPQSSGGVQMEITPEVHYGQPRAQFVRREFALQLKPGRERRVFDQLRIEAELEPGQMLVLGPTSQLKGLGRHFFADDVDGSPRRKLLVIRLAQTQFDGLFAPEQIRAPIATPAE